MDRRPSPPQWRILAFITACGLVLAAGASTLEAQGFPTQDPVVRRMWTLGTDSSQVETLAQVLTDSIGPR